MSARPNKRAGQSDAKKAQSEILVTAGGSARKAKLLIVWVIGRLSLVTPNAPMSGAEVRSTEAYAPLAG